MLYPLSYEGNVQSGSEPANNPSASTARPETEIARRVKLGTVDPRDP